MLEPVSVGLKFGFLVVLYLFLLWVARSALKDLRRPSPGGRLQVVRATADDATGMYSAADGLGRALRTSSSRDCWWSRPPDTSLGSPTT